MMKTQTWGFYHQGFCVGISTVDLSTKQAAHTVFGDQPTLASFLIEEGARNSYSLVELGLFVSPGFVNDSRECAPHTWPRRPA